MRTRPTPLAIAALLAAPWLAPALPAAGAPSDTAMVRFERPRAASSIPT